MRLKVVTKPYNIEGLTIPPNVEVFHVFGDPVMELYHDAQFVIIPMAYDERPGGESVMLESMAYGKAIVMTKTVTSDDFVTDGENGFTYPLGNREQLEKAVRTLLDQPALCEKIGRRNKERYHQQFSTEASARNVKDAIMEIYQSKAAS